jgi:hypothetical protein
LTLSSEGGSPGVGAGVFVKASGERLVVEEAPEAVSDLLQPDALGIGPW